MGRLMALGTGRRFSRTPGLSKYDVGSQRGLCHIWSLVSFCACAYDGIVPGRLGYPKNQFVNLGCDIVVTSGRVRQRIGPTLRMMRLRRGLSLNELAERAEISPSHLSRIERGLTVPSYDVLDNIATALGSDLTSLRSREKSARAVDEDLRSYFDEFGMPLEAQQELLGLSHETRSALADLVAAIADEDADA